MTVVPRNNPQAQAQIAAQQRAGTIRLAWSHPMNAIVLLPVCLKMRGGCRSA